VHAHKHDHGTNLALDCGESHPRPHWGHAGHNGQAACCAAVDTVLPGVEALAGWWSGSLALLADAAHMLTEDSHWGLAAAAPGWRATAQHAAFLCLVSPRSAGGPSTVWLMLALIAHRQRAIDRIGTPRDIAAQPPPCVGRCAVIGPRQPRGCLVLHSANQTPTSRAALLHVLADRARLIGGRSPAASSIVTTGWTPIDPLLRCWWRR